jgi:hypothetical protein
MPRWTNTNFTKHARQRLEERFTIPPDTLIEQLNIGQLGIRLTMQGETRILHRLTWSETDNDYLVVVQDIVDGNIITILSLDMVKLKYPEKITEAKLRRAKNQVLNRIKKLGSYDKKVTNNKNKLKLAVYGGFLTNDSSIELKMIGRWKNVPDDELAQLTSQKEFLVWVGGKIVDKSYDLSALKYISVGYKLNETVQLVIKDE